MSSYIMTDRQASIKVAAPSGGWTRDQLVLINGIVGLVWEATDAAAIARVCYRAEKALVPITGASGSNFLAGSPIYYDVATGGRCAATDGNGINPMCGIVLETPAASAATAKVHLMGDKALVRPQTVYSHEESVAVADINTGKTIVPEVAGRTLRVVGYRLVVTGAAAGATDIRLSDTNTSPVDIVTVAAAAATNGAIIGSHGVAIANVTPGAGLNGNLTAGKGIQIRKTGDTLTTTTAIAVQVSYVIM